MIVDAVFSVDAVLRLIHMNDSNENFYLLADVEFGKGSFGSFFLKESGQV